MTPDERLTAYALNDPGLSAADRGEVEAALEADPAAKQAVEETRKLVELLTAGLQAEQAATPAGEFVTVPAAAAKRRRWTMWAVAASVLLAFAGGVGTYWTVHPTIRLASNRSNRTAALVPAGEQGGSPRSDASSKPLDLVRDSIQAYAPPYAVEQGQIGASGSPDPPLGAELPEKADGGQPAPAKPFLPTAGLPRPPQAAGVNPFGEDTNSGKIVRRGENHPDAAKPTPGEPSPPADGEPGRPRTRLSERGLADPQAAGDRYPALRENAFVAVEGQNALSTFGIDVDTASYSIVRKYLTMGQMPPANAVRLEELVNYFPYRDPAPEGADPFAVRVEMAACPWQPAHRLVRVGLKAKPVMTDQRPPSNLVFLIDVSGSMNEPNKLPLVKASLMMLVGQLGENDRVAMVVYAGASGLVLDSTPATKKADIIGALDRLQAGGSTNGSGGLRQAYDVAVANFVKGGTNRVILCTDGDWNVGTTSTPDLIKLVEEKRTTGVFLSVLGYGMGNLRDEMMVQLAGKGNGNYAYIDTAREANKALVEQLGGTLVTVAKDVKVQIEFNPAAVKAYRLLGYEKRILAAKDFHDDRKDAGEMGAGHVVTALYELVPADGTVPSAEKVDELRYQKKADAAPKAKVKADEAFVVKMRHKKPDADASTLRELPVANVSKGYGEASEDFRFAAAVASFAMLVRESAYKGNATFAAVQELADAARGHDPSGYRAEFSDLVKRAKAVSGRP